MAGTWKTVFIKPTEGTVDELIADRAKLTGILERLTGTDPVSGTTQAKGAVLVPKSHVEFAPPSEAILGALKRFIPMSIRLLEGGDPVSLDRAAYSAVDDVAEKKHSAAAAVLIGGTRSIPPPEPNVDIVFRGDRPMVQMIVSGDRIVFLTGLKSPKG